MGGETFFLVRVLIEQCFGGRVVDGVAKNLFFHAARRGLAADAVMVRHCGGGDASLCSSSSKSVPSEPDAEAGVSKVCLAVNKRTIISVRAGEWKPKGLAVG